jgi:glycosyltransferase involved in cell wall biosynthesis
MERRKILVIGMLDSIHLARWLEQFSDQKIDFYMFPSKKFKYLNSDLLRLLKSSGVANYRLARPYLAFKYIGFLNEIARIVFKKFDQDIQLTLLNRILLNNKFMFVHAIEIQGAGYLYRLLPKSTLDQNKLIITNYGSDILYFRNFPEHASKIRSILEIAKYYSGECQRDYELAITNNFTGTFLPCIPNAGGFNSEIFTMNVTPSKYRNLIIAKCYGGMFGLGGLIIDALNTFLKTRPSVQVLLYSVTDDLISQVEMLKFNFSNQITYYRVRDKVERKVFLEYFSRARLYIGASRSDGISTSFLESLCLGAYAIQTNTSCGNEWLDRGFIATLVQPRLSSLIMELDRYDDTHMLEKARVMNLLLSQKFLNDKVIKDEALKFYRLDKQL